MTHWKLSDDAICQNVGHEMVIMHLGTSHYFEANAMATEILHLIQAGMTEQELFAELLDRYDVEAERLSHDLKSMISEMVQKKIIVQSE